MNSVDKKKPKKGKTLKVLSREIIDSIRADQGKDLPVIADSIKHSVEGNQHLKEAMLNFIEIYLQRRSFSPEEMKMRIDEVCAQFAKHKSYELKARARLLLASHYLVTYRHFAESLSELIAVELIAQRHLGNNHMILCEALFTKGSVYYFQGDLESSNKAIEQALALQVFVKATHELQYKLHVNLARNYSMLKNAVKLREHLEKAEKSWEHYLGEYDRGALFLRRSDLLQFENNWEGAYQILNEGLEFYKATPYILRTAEFYKEIGVFLSSKENPFKDFKKAVESLEQALLLSREMKIQRMESAILENLWQAAFDFQEWKICSEKLIEYNDVMNSIKQEELNIHLKRLEQFDKEEKLRLMSEGKPSYNKDIVDEVMQLRVENDLLRKKNSHFQNILSDLDSVVERISQSSKMRPTIIHELEKIVEKGRRNISVLDAKLSESEDLYPSFSSSLLKLIPSITPMELKVAKLIRIGLNTQYISSVCGVTTKSIENHRMNLRKKCNLGPKQSLSAYIMSVT